MYSLDQNEIEVHLISDADSRKESSNNLYAHHQESFGPLLRGEGQIIPDYHILN